MMIFVHQDRNFLQVIHGCRLNTCVLNNTGIIAVTLENQEDISKIKD